MTSESDDAKAQSAKRECGLVCDDQPPAMSSQHSLFDIGNFETGAASLTGQSSAVPRATQCLEEPYWQEIPVNSLALL